MFLVCFTFCMIKNSHFFLFTRSYFSKDPRIVLDLHLRTNIENTIKLSNVFETLFIFQHYLPEFFLGLHSYIDKISV